MGGQLSGGFSGLQVEAEALVPDHACSTQDWAKPGPYDQPLVNTLQRRKEKREPDPSGGGPAAAGGAPAATEEAQRPRSMTVSAATRVTRLFSSAGRGPPHLARGHVLASGWRDLSPFPQLPGLWHLEDPQGRSHMGVRL